MKRWTSFSYDKLCINIYFHPKFIIYRYFEFVFSSYSIFQNKKKVRVNNHQHRIRISMLNTAERFFLMSFCREQQNMGCYGSDTLKWHVLEGLDEISIMSLTWNQNTEEHFGWRKRSTGYIWCQNMFDIKYQSWLFYLLQCSDATAQ